jgi:ubiquinol-cytochrome c reductase cytochrome b subunit
MSAPSRAGRYVDDRLRAAHFARKAANKVFPDHWSFMLGEVALYAFVVLVATGVFLTFFFDPSQAKSAYTGSYHPLQGVMVSRAYATALELSFQIRVGLLMRQMHHWAALLFIWAIVAHLCRIFFTGAFRRPREINWMVGVTLLILALFNDFFGYSLLDDLLSGTGLRVANGIIQSIPVVGSWLAYLFFNGPWPSDTIIPRLYVLHVLLIPGLIVALLGAHLSILWRQKHTQFPGPGRSRRTVVGSRLWPEYTAKSIGLFAIVAGVIAAFGAFVQINPIWRYGPYQPGTVSTYAQPDFALGWVEGAMRLFPGWELVIAHRYRVPAGFWPAVFFPTIVFLLLYAWPFLDRKLTGDREEHNVIDRPRDRPGRSAFGLGALTFFAVLLVAGAQDILAEQLQVGIRPVTWSLRIAVVVLPFVVGAVSFKLLRDLHRSHEQPEDTDAIEAPNEVDAALAPSPVGPAPELIPAIVYGDGDGPDDDGRDGDQRGERVAEVALATAGVGYAVVRGLRRLRRRFRQEP